MQLHQLIDKCIEWIAMDGCLGTEPLALHQYLSKSDPSLDDAYFAYLYTVLVEHPSIRVSLTTEPLAAPDKTVRLGTAPLPDDYEVPNAAGNLDISGLYQSGIRGRALAFHLAGQEYKSNAQAVGDRRDAQKANAAAIKTAAQRKVLEAKKKADHTSPEDGLIVDLDVDDGDGIAKEDLNGLAQRWGSRLRLRCTDDEIYYRLTGSHQKNPKITPIVFQTLQHAAKSREKGITAVELAPLVGASQGSMHHYMKVLTRLGLCSKVPYIIHAALTNLLIFHTYLQQNDTYRATKLEQPVTETVQQSGVSGALEDDDGEADDSAIAPGPATASDWGLSFSELTETQLMNGFVLKERLLKLLDHPSLTNHLLRAKNLLPLLGWKADAGLRHRRAVPRVVRALIESGQVEYVEVGEKRIRCLRLTKYNPDHVPRSRPGDASKDMRHQHDLGQLVNRYSQPLRVTGGITSLQSVPFQIGDLILKSGPNGMRITELRDALFGLFKRMVEFHFTRLDKMISPPLHLQHRRVRHVMESWGKERRLRAFTVPEYRKLLIQSNEPVDDNDHPPTPPEAGHFAIVSYRKFCSEKKAFDKYMDNMGTPATGVSIVVQRVKQKSQATRPAVTTSAEGSNFSPMEILQDDPKVSSTAPKPPKYGQEGQIRGRPRKYIHVVLPDGKVERNIIGSVLPHPDLAPIWLYLVEIDKLVPANPEYSGLGEAPTPTEEEMKQAQAPEWFAKLPRPKGTKMPLPHRRQALAKEAGIQGPSKARSKGKNKRKEPSNSPDFEILDDEPEEEPDRRSKRPRKSRVQVEEVSSHGPEREEASSKVPITRVAPRDVVVQASDIDPSLDPSPTSRLDAHADIDVNSDSALNEVASSQVAPEPASESDIDPTLIGDSSSRIIPDRAIATGQRLGSKNGTARPTVDPIEAPPMNVGASKDDDSRRHDSRLSVNTSRDTSPVSRDRVFRAHTDPRLARLSPEDAIPVDESNQHVHDVAVAPVDVLEQPDRHPTRDQITSAPLREISPPRMVPMPPFNTSAPYTPSYPNQSVPYPHYYTPPGVQSFSILPPVVYVPPGFTVWPPLPPGYPTTDIPPPGYPGSPSAGPPGAMPGYWNYSPGHHSPQQPPYRQPAAHQHSQPHHQPQIQHSQRQPPPVTHSSRSSTTPASSRTSTRLAPIFNTPSRSSTTATRSSSLLRREQSAAPTDSREQQPEPQRSDDPIGGETHAQQRIRESSQQREVPLDASGILSHPQTRHVRSPSRPASTPMTTEAALPAAVPDKASSSTPEAALQAIVQDAAVSSSPNRQLLQTPMPADASDNQAQDSSPPFDDTTMAASPRPDPAPTIQPIETPRAASGVPDAAATPVSNGEPELIPIRPSKTLRKGRVDLGNVRRANELLFVLQQVGGVSEEHELWKRHQEWSHRVTGTDAPHAPIKGSTMDRSVWKRLIQSTKDDGRTDNTLSSVPTSTAAWRNNRIMWLVDTPEATVQQYMRALANTIKKATAPKEITKTKLPHMQYTEVKLPHQHPSSTAKTVTVEDIDKESRELTGDQRRDALLKDPEILSQLYGRQSGKWTRTSTFHRALRTTVGRPGCSTVLDASAGVFLAPMMSKDIPVGAWYSVVLTHERDDQLLDWLKDPSNRKVPVKEVPFKIDQSHDQRRQRTQTRIRAHVDMLLGLGVLSPLAITSEDKAYVIVNTPHMPNAPLKIDTKQSLVDGWTTTYVLHDWAPIYNIMSSTPAMLGYLPVRTEAEIDKFWDTYRRVCLEGLSERLPEFVDRAFITSRNVADMPEVLRISAKRVRSMGQFYRWQHDMKLIPVQREALNSAIDWESGVSNIQTPEQLRAFAWEFALPEDAVKRHLDHRIERASASKGKRERHQREYQEARRNRQVRAQKALAVKLNERQAQSKRIWEERVANISARLQAPFDQEVLDYVSRQSLTYLTKGGLTDEVIERMIRQHFSHRLLQAVKDNVAPPTMPLEPVAVVRRKAPRDVVRRNRQSTLPRTRYRRKWTPEDDELIVDAEAIIRARNRDRAVNARTRAGMAQLFPGCAAVTFVARLKKAINTPQREAYLTLLENAWYKLWMEYRGSTELPDDHPEHNGDFNLRLQIDFLRKHVNKTEMGVEAQALATNVPPIKKEVIPDLPDHLEKLLGGYKWQTLAISRPSFDVLWQPHNSQEYRLGQVGSISLLGLENVLEQPAIADLSRNRLRGILKMIVATPSSEYDQPAAIALLKDYDQLSTVNPEIARMQAEKVLMKHHSASSTGRFYTFGAAWDTMRQGPFASEFFQDAVQLEQKISKPEGLEWPVIGASGELAHLMNMVSAQTVNFELDPQNFPTVVARQGIFNTRRLNDVSFEFGFKARKAPESKPDVELPSLYDCPVPRRWEDGHDVAGVDFTPLYREVEKAGAQGVTKPKLMVALRITSDELAHILAALPSIRPSQVFWAGYDTARLVSTEFWSEWQCPARQYGIGSEGRLIPSGVGEVRCTPRIWVDIWGRRIAEKWQEAVGCAKGWLLSRPGMTERIFREKLDAAMDRLEVNDILQYLVDRDAAERTYVDGRDDAMIPIEAVSVEEEDSIVWHPDPRRLLL